MHLYTISFCSACSSEQFRCDNGRCVPDSQKCDGTDDWNHKQGCGRYHTILHEVNVVMDIKSINVWLILPCHLKSYIACYIASDPYTENLDLAIGLLTAGFVTVIFYGIPCCVSIYIKTWTKTVLQPHCYRTVPSSSSHYGDAVPMGQVFCSSTRTFHVITSRLGHQPQQ